MEKYFDSVYNQPMDAFKAAFLIMLFLFMSPVLASAQNSCVQCHEGIENPAIREFHKEWKASAHSRSGITCEYCHGGDPGKSGKEAAHQGIRNALDRESLVYYTKIPALCGGCHIAAFSEFKTSTHYSNLVTKGAGPNCVTCHDAMATKIIKPGEIEIFCALCHNAQMNLLPGVTRDARSCLERMDLIGQKIQEAEKALVQAEKSGTDTIKARGFLSLAGREYDASKQDWHSFQLNRVASRLKGVELLVQKALDSLIRPKEDRTE
ncbi:MAG: hypothetical protein AABY87_04080 [bacterium]